MIKTIVILRRNTMAFNLDKALKHDSRFKLAGRLDTFTVMMDVAEKTRIDCVICDPIAEDMDFHECAIRMANSRLEYVPRIVLVCPIVTNKLFERFIDLGAADVISADTDSTVLLDRLANDHKRYQDSLELSSLLPDAAPRSVKNWLMLLEIGPKLSAYRYITEAMTICGERPHMLNNITKNLYAMIAERFCSKPQNVERAIRHGIESMWKKASPRYINDLFCNPHKAHGSKAPSNREFLAALYERLNPARSIPMRSEMLMAAEPPAEYDRTSPDDGSRPVCSAEPVPE